MPSDADITAWATACRASTEHTARLHDLLTEARETHREFRQRMRLGQTQLQQSFDDLVRDATSIRCVGAVVIPGLLQTRDYAKARLAENVTLYDADESGIDAATTARMRRQEALYDSSKQFEFIIGEAALRYLLCPAPAMRAHLDRLLGLALGGPPNVCLGIIPFGTRLHAVPLHGYILIDDLAIVETLATETTHHGDEAATYTQITDRLAAEAVYGHDGAEIILNATRALRAEPY